MLEKKKKLPLDAAVARSETQRPPGRAALFSMDESREKNPQILSAADSDTRSQSAPGPPASQLTHVVKAFANGTHAVPLCFSLSLRSEDYIQNLDF